MSRILVFSCRGNGTLVVSGRGCTYEEDIVHLFWFLLRLLIISLSFLQRARITLSLVSPLYLLL